MIQDQIVRLSLNADLAQEIELVIAPYVRYTLAGDDGDLGKLEPVRFFSWSSGPGENNNIPFFWLRNDRKNKSATEWASECALNFANKEKGERCLFVWKPNGTNGFPTPIPNHEYYNLLKFGANFESRVFFEEFFQALKDMGEQPDVIVLDYEGGPTLWANRDEDEKLSEMRLIWKEPELLDQLSPWFKDSKAEPDWVVSGHPQRNKFHHEWAYWASQFMISTMVKLIYEPYFEVFGEDIPFSNYGNKNISFPTREWNGRMNEYPITGTGHSAPVNYVLALGHDYNEKRQEWRDGKAKHPRWGLLIDKLNAVRSCVNTEGPEKVLPWMSCLGYEIQHNKWNLAPPFADLHLQGHCIMMGVDKFFYWNPGPPSQWPDDTRQESDEAYHQLASNLDIARANRPKDVVWEPIDRDADEFETNGFKTTYADFERFGISDDDR